MQRLVPLLLQVRYPREQRALYTLPVLARDGVLRLQRLNLPQQLGLGVSAGPRRRLFGLHPHGFELALHHLQLGLHLQLEGSGSLVGPLGLLLHLVELYLCPVCHEVLVYLQSGQRLLQLGDALLVLLQGLIVDFRSHSFCLLRRLGQLSAQLRDEALLRAQLWF